MSDQREEEKEESFKVTDRRKFSAEGEFLGHGEEERPAAEPPPRPAEPRSADPKRAQSRDPAAQPEVDFSSFVLSLATSAMVNMGEIADPATGKKVESLEGARHMIELLSMLQEKTQGNLSAEESRLLEGVLYELRMKFLTKSKFIQL